MPKSSVARGFFFKNTFGTGTEERKELKKTTRNGSSNSKTEGRTDNDAGEKKSNNTAPASPNKTKKKMERPLIQEHDVPKLSPDARRDRQAVASLLHRGGDGDDADCRDDDASDHRAVKFSV